MEASETLEEARVEAFLAPLSTLAPATRRARPRLRLPRVPRVAIAFAGALLLAGGAAVAATQVFGPAHYIDATPSPSPWTCSGLVGESGAQVDAYLQAHGYSDTAAPRPGPHEASWRYETFSDKVYRQPNGTTPGAIEGYSKVTDGPVPGSVVTNLGPISNEPGAGIEVFTQAAHDPNAPRATAPTCAARR